MGLDQWLKREIYLGTHYQHRETKVDKIEVSLAGKKIEIPTENLSSISYEFIYWRKSNQIHKWFVDKVQDGEDDCKEYEVSKEKLNNLKEVLARVIEIKEEIVKEHGTIGKDISVRHKEELDEILPSSSGFFFGSTDYDEYYFSDIERTLEELNKEFKFIEENKNLDIWYKYSSSW